MGLRGRFTLWFSLAALVTIGVAALVTRQVVSQSFQDDFKRTRESADRDATRALRDLGFDVEGTVRALAQDNRDVEGILFELQTHGSIDADSMIGVKRRSEGMMRGSRLDLLFLIDDTGKVLSAPHGAAVGEADEVWRERARQTKGAPYFAREPIDIDGEPRALLVAVSARTVRDKGRALTVVGGRIVRPHLLDGVRQEGRVETRIVDAGGNALVQSGEWTDVEAAPIRLPLPGYDGAAVATLEVAISDAYLSRLQRQVTVAAAAIAAGALLLATLLGFFVARGMTADLHELVSGVEAAARGDLDHRVTARKSDEIGAVATAVNDMMADLKAANERLAVAQRIAAWQEIARRLAHEIKNPLTPIQMSVETLRKTKSKNHPSFEEVFDESTRTVLEEVARLKRIVSEFSEFARMPKPTRKPTDLNEVVTSTTALYKGSHDIVETLAPDLPEIEADRDQLSQVVLNLLENARDAIKVRGDADGGGRIAIETRVTEAGAAVQLVLDDNGPGFSAEVRGKLFTPYFTTKHAAGGTGLGLAIVHRIVSDHDGKITVGDAPSGGARVTIELPVEPRDVSS